MPKDTLNSEDEELTPIKGRYRNEVQNTKVQTQKGDKGQKGNHAFRLLSGEEGQAFGGRALCGGTPYEPDIAANLPYHDL